MLIIFGKNREILPIVPRALGRQLYSLARWYSKIHHYKDAASDPCSIERKPWPINSNHSQMINWQISLSELQLRDRKCFIRTMEFDKKDMIEGILN